MRNSLCGLPIALLLTTAAFAQVDRRTIRTPAEDPAGVQRASCVVQIDNDTGRNSGYRQQFDSQTLNAILSSTALLDPVAKKALNLEPSEWPKVAQVELQPAGQLAVRVGVTVSGATLAPTAAKQFLNELTSAGKLAVEQAGNRSVRATAKRIAGLETELKNAQSRYDAASAALASTPRPGTVDGDARFFGRNIVYERSNMQLTLTGQRARLKVLEKELTTLKPATQPTIGDGAYERLNYERITLRLNIAETEAKLEAMSEPGPLANTTTAPNVPADYDRLNMDLSNARQSLQQAQSALESAKRDAQMGGGVRLLILDGRNNDE
jgi:hypothetical protein